ncbi:cuticle protein 8-like [Macrobrachium nipponense]|uniref:cuticle protein 8-like n=1 Tax=Macrobrachium nipponense TaxID=159736 RepID=UPI0030C8BEC2
MPLRCDTVGSSISFIVSEFETLWMGLIVVAVAVAYALADLPPSYESPAPSYHTPAPVGPAQYNFNYAVKDDYSKNDFGHQEARDGFDTKGTYYFQLPNGRLQKVPYYANGDSGYVA